MRSRFHTQRGSCLLGWGGVWECGQVAVAWKGRVLTPLAGTFRGRSMLPRTILAWSAGSEGGNVLLDGVSGFWHSSRRGGARPGWRHHAPGDWPGHRYSVLHGPGTEQLCWVSCISCVAWAWPCCLTSPPPPPVTCAFGAWGRRTFGA